MQTTKIPCKCPVCVRNRRYLYIVNTLPNNEDREFMKAFLEVFMDITEELSILESHQQE